jgi:glycosyltransferase involved in cell wall biosynthesis
MKKFTVITPCFNAAHLIGDTVASITSQSLFTTGKARLEYIMCDGGSTDATIPIAERILKEAANCEYRIISERDNGMYDALVKGLKTATGDYCAYLNAGDLYAPGCFEVLDELLVSERIQWITGLRVLINDNAQVTGIRLPFRFTRSFVIKGYYGRFLPFIQQESTFWRKDMISALDLDYLKTLKLAGDYYLWARFATRTDLYIAETQIGAFRIHRGQKSEDKSAYFKERKSFLKPAGLSLLADLPGILYEWLYFFADYNKTKANRKTLIAYSHSKGQWQLPS